MYCPYCGTENESDAVYCLNCGKPLNDQPPTANISQAVVQNTTHSENPAITPPSNTLVLPYHITGQSSQAVFNVWGPFAGYGKQNCHNGWLMDNKGDRAGELVEKVKTKFSDRKIPDAWFTEEKLTAKGLIVEQRPYFLLKRRMITVGLYISQFGKDLFVSIVSYLKPPISYLRVAIVGLMLLFAMYTTFILPRVLESKINGLFGGLFGGGGNASGLMSILCFVGPLGTLNIFLLGLLTVFSVFKWLTEKDFFAALRTKPNEFDEDDLMSMEKAVEQTVRMSLDEIGLDSNDLIPLQNQEFGRLI